MIALSQSSSGDQMASLHCLVCKKCLEDDPSRTELTTCRCFHEDLHLKEPRVKVVLSPSNSRLECTSPTFNNGNLPQQPKPRPAATAKFLQPAYQPPPLHPCPPNGSSSVKGTGQLTAPSASAQHKHEEANVQESAPLTRMEKEFDVIKLLGKGGFGVVYHVKGKLDCKDFAIKIIKLPSEESEQEKVKREVKVLAQLDHYRIVRYSTSWIEMAPPGWRDKKIWEDLKSSETQSTSYAYSNVVGEDDSSAPSNSTEMSGGDAVAESSTTDSLVEFKEGTSSHKSPDEANKGAPKVTVASAVPFPLERPTCLFIQTEYCKEQTLYHWLRENINNRPRKKVFDYFEQILEAVVYIHDMGFVHRDLTPSNIFFSDMDNLKVGDFGLVTAAGPSNLTPPGSGTDSQSCSGASSTSSTCSINFHGNFYYMSPERLDRKRIPKKQIQKVDIFSLGVIFFELCYPLNSEHERHKVLTDVREKKLPQEFCDNLPKEAELICTLLDPEPSRRPTAQQVYLQWTSLKNQSTDEDSCDDFQTKLKI